MKIKDLYINLCQTQKIKRHNRSECAWIALTINEKRSSKAGEAGGLRMAFYFLRLALMACAVFCFPLSAISKNDLTAVLQKNSSAYPFSYPFSYPLNIQVIPAKENDASVTICCHGMGGDNRIAWAVKASGVADGHLVSFDFPDCEAFNRSVFDPSRTTFGSLDELLPALFVIKRCVIDAQLEAIDLYGFSAGGGALVNLIGVLNDSCYDDRLEQIGIGKASKQRLLDAIQKGSIILDCPLKSVEEIIDLRGESAELVVIADRYRKNRLRPIDNAQKLNGLALRALIYFSVPDEILSNRDDRLFIQRFRLANKKGQTRTILGSDGGHNSYHRALWEAYPFFISSRSSP